MARAENLSLLSVNKPFNFVEKQNVRFQNPCVFWDSFGDQHTTTQTRENDNVVGGG